ncbi:MAG TPA: YceI family protein [Saprospiraceae bacterium]|nr:YceI family protein [Saprospiraceae bacterium]HMQ84395.1 YceI family protein [Saprospiraceae bacterium]
MQKWMIFSSVLVLFAACTNAPEGQKVEATQAETAVEQPNAQATSYRVNTAASTIEWQGTEPSGDGHYGVIGIQGGSLRVVGDQISGGTFVLDMNSISVSDLTGGKKEKLESHLKDGDFFETNRFPSGKFEITAVEAVSGNPEITHNITGNLTLRDTTKSITIPAQVSLADGSLTAVTPKFTIDRTQWGVVYRSGLIGTLKDKLIDDQIGLKIKLEAQKVN